MTSKRKSRGIRIKQKWNGMRSFHQDFLFNPVIFQAEMMRRSSQEKAARRVGGSRLATGIRENWIHERERETETENAVHFNSRFLNLLSLTSIFTLALHFISSLGFLPFGKSLQDEYPANPSRIHPRLFVLFSIQRACSFASTPLYSRPRFRFPFSRLLS